MLKILENNRILSAMFEFECKMLCCKEVGVGEPGHVLTVSPLCPLVSTIFIVARNNCPAPTNKLFSNLHQHNNLNTQMPAMYTTVIVLLITHKKYQTSCKKLWKLLAYKAMTRREKYERGFVIYGLADSGSVLMTSQFVSCVCANNIFCCFSSRLVLLNAELVDEKWPFLTVNNFPIFKFYTECKMEIILNHLSLSEIGPKQLLKVSKKKSLLWT